MRVEQAIFSSCRTSKVQGYHLIARSSGIDNTAARTLSPWGPSHAGLANSEPDTSSLNFHPVDQRWLALSRTVYGGPEYSGRGNLQLVTHILLLRPEQLEGYDYNPLALARVALALGHLRFEPEAPTQLSGVDLPARPTSSSPPSPSALGPDARVANLASLLSRGGRAAVVGASDPIGVLANLFGGTPVQRRLELSFTTGLTPSMHRPFRLHFLPSSNAMLEAQLLSQKVVLLSWN